MDVSVGVNQAGVDDTGSKCVTSGTHAFPLLNPGSVVLFFLLWGGLQWTNDETSFSSSSLFFQERFSWSMEHVSPSLLLVLLLLLLLLQTLFMVVLSLRLASSCSGAAKYHCRHKQHGLPHPPRNSRPHSRLSYALPYTPSVTSACRKCWTVPEIKAGARLQREREICQDHWWSHECFLHLIMTSDFKLLPWLSRCDISWIMEVRSERRPLPRLVFLMRLGSQMPWVILDVQGGDLIVRN